MQELEKKLNYTFRNSALLQEALNHSSYANEHRSAHLHSNERLEFLGDSVLGFVTAEFLFTRHPESPEGDLTRIRAALVCEQSLYEVDMEDVSFDEFRQIEEFSQDVEYLQEYRSEYLNLDRTEYEAAFRGDTSMDASDREYCESHFAFLVEQILTCCQDILTERADYEDSYLFDVYGGMSERAEQLLTGFEEEAEATLRVLFGFDDGQIEELVGQSYLDEEQRQAYVEQIKEGWLGE